WMASPNARTRGNAMRPAAPRKSCKSCLLRVRSAPVEHDLAGLARPRYVKPLLEAVRAHFMRQHGRDVQAALQHGDHLVPGLEHLAAVDALDEQSLEDHL